MFKANSILGELNSPTVNSIFSSNKELLSGTTKVVPATNRLNSAKATNLITKQNTVNFRKKLMSMADNPLISPLETYSRYFTSFNSSSTLPWFSNNQEMLINNKSKFNNSLNLKSIKADFALHREPTSWVLGYSTFMAAVNENLNQYTSLIRSTDPLALLSLRSSSVFSLTESSVFKYPTSFYKAMLLRTNLNAPVLADQDFKVWDSLELLEDVTEDLNLTPSYFKSSPLHTEPTAPLNNMYKLVGFRGGNSELAGFENITCNLGGVASMLQVSFSDLWPTKANYSLNSSISSLFGKFSFMNSMSGAHSSLKFSEQLLAPLSLSLKYKLHLYPQTVNYSQKVLN